MNILILGNSQAQGAGSRLESNLKKEGNTVKRVSKHGAKNQDLIKLYDGKRYDLIIIFSGDTSSIDSLLAKLNCDDLIWYGPPPATRITDLEYARKVFGSKVTGENYWFESGHSDERERKNKELKSRFGDRYVDWRDLGVDGEKQKSGIVFPSMRDGIHIDPAHYSAMFAPKVKYGGIANAGMFFAVAGILLAVVIVAKKRGTI